MSGRRWLWCLVLEPVRNEAISSPLYFSFICAGLNPASSVMGSECPQWEYQMVLLSGLFLAPHPTFYRYVPKAHARVNLMFALGPSMEERECVGKRMKSAKTGRRWKEFSVVLRMASAILAGAQVPRELTVTPAQLAHFSGVSQRLVTRTCHCSTRCKQHLSFQLGC